MYWKKKLLGKSWFRVKFQEAGGIQLARLFSTNLTKRESSQREDCLTCLSKEGLN